MASKATSALRKHRYAFPLLTVDQVQAYFQSNQLTSIQLARYCRALAQQHHCLYNNTIFSYTPPWESVAEQAERCDTMRVSIGKSMRSPLHGIPVAIKANIAVADWPLTAGSRILDASTPIGYSAAVVTALEEAGAVLMGHTAMDEFGMGSLGTNTSASSSNGGGATIQPPVSLCTYDNNDPATILSILHLPPEAIQEAMYEQQQLEKAQYDLRNEQSSAYLPGGSSSGSAVAVASGAALLAVGSDTGGSVRFPAALCGVVGLKPSYGWHSRYGLVSYASSLDTIGWLGPSVACVRHGLCLREGTIGLSDATQQPPQVKAKVLEAMNISHDVRGLRVGLPEAFSMEEMSGRVRDAWQGGAERLMAQGMEVCHVSDDSLSADLIRQALAAYYVLVSAEAASNLSRYDGLRYGAEQTASINASAKLEDVYADYRSQGFGREVMRRILCGTAVLSSDLHHTHYEAATQVRAAISNTLRSLLTDSGLDALLIPTSMTAEPPTTTTPIDPTSMLANDILTVSVSLAGFPAISVPFRQSTVNDVRFPPGLQIVAATEDVVLRVAEALQPTPK